MPALAEPVLALQIGNLQKLTVDHDLSTVWNLFTKCKDSLENGHRLENLSWRLWYRSCHPPANKKQINPISSLSQPMEKNLKVDLSVPVIPPFQQKEVAAPIQVKAPAVQNFEIAAASLMGPVVPEFTSVPQRNVLVKPVPTRPTPAPVTINQVSKPVDIKPVSTVATKPKTRSPPKERSRATFFISESQSSHSTIGSYRSNYSEDDDSDLESDISGDSYVEAPTLFLKNCKSNLPIKRASLLSVAIQRQAFRRSQSHNTQIDTLPQDIPQPIYSQDIDISPSLKENLAWDHARPFNTTAKVEGRRHLDSTPISSSFNYW